MLKTHEKSRIRVVAGTLKADGLSGVVLQIEATGIRNEDGNIYLVETVDPKEYDRTTAEGRAAALKRNWTTK